MGRVLSLMVSGWVPICVRSCRPRGVRRSTPTLPPPLCARFAVLIVFPVSLQVSQHTSADRSSSSCKRAHLISTGTTTIFSRDARFHRESVFLLPLRALYNASRAPF